MTEVWKLELTHSQMLVALALADHGDDAGGNIFPSLGHIAWKCGYDKRQVRRIVRRLETTGLLVKVAEGSGTRAAEYRLDVSAGTSKRDWEIVRDEMRRSKPRPTGGGQNARPRSGVGGQYEPTRADISSPCGRTFETPMGGHFEPPRADIAMSAEPSVEPSPESSVPTTTQTALVPRERAEARAAGGGGEGEDQDRFGDNGTPTTGTSPVEEPNDEPGGSSELWLEARERIGAVIARRAAG